MNLEPPNLVNVILGIVFIILFINLLGVLAK
jgi:hypothetical protein